jgi:transposase
VTATKRIPARRVDPCTWRCSLPAFNARFPDDGACMEYLWKSRYSFDGTHAACPKCTVERSFRHYEILNRPGAWTCTTCGHHIHPTAGTIFHKSSTPLTLWFYAVYLVVSTEGRISAKQLQRELGVTYKTAWRMSALIRSQLTVPQVEP